jgi:transposase-like protein
VAFNRKQKLEMARQLLESSGNDLTWVAAQLGIHPTTLYRWRKTKKI